MNTNVEWRSPVLEDLQGFAALAAISDERDGALEATFVDELASRLRWDGGIDDVARVVTLDGNVIGVGWARTMSTARLANWRRCLYAFVAPDQPGLCAELLRWLDAAAARAFGPGDV